MKEPAVYIMASKPRSILYTGVTSNLVQRAYPHKNGITGGFSHRHGCKTLVYYEAGGNMEGAIFREKQIKAGSRKNKINLIESMNPGWIDWYGPII